ncbi:MAG: hypothetical protein P4L99_01085 [Chthoniobacter sp.]|nr:hypothetical protein [Chthoniobacter sp.]
MKSLKFLAAATMLAGALVQQASATTQHIYITGSTAFRAAAIAAIGSVTHLGNTSGVNGIVANGGTGNDTTYTNSTPPAGTSTTGTQNTTFIWEGGYITNSDSSTTPVTVCATFTGSTGGYETNMGSLAIPFLPDGSSGTTANKSAYADAAGSIPNLTTFTYTDSSSNSHNGFYPTTVLVVPQLNFGDSFQSSTLFTPGSIALGSPYNTTATFVQGNDNPIGFVTFKWLASKNFPLGTGSTGVDQGTIFGSGYRVSSINVNSNSLINLFTGGSIPLSQLTGSTGDQTTQLFATGRNFDSGTRTITFADSEIGTGTSVYQYEPASSGGVVVSQQPYPIVSVDGLSTVTLGNSGEASGGTLRAFLGLTLPSIGQPNFPITDEGSDVTAAYYVTYLGTADASNGAVAGTAVELSYKGVPFSAQGIYQGQYSFWSVEHIVDRGNLTGVPLQFRKNLVTTFNGFASTAFSKAGLSNLDVTNNVFQASRQSDGGLISVTFNP